MQSQGNKSTARSTLLQPLAGVLMVVLGVLTLIAILKFGSLVGFVFVYPWVKVLVSGVVLDPHLANIIAAILAFVIVSILYRYRYQPRYTLAILTGLIVFQSTFLFLGEKDRFFRLDNGAPIKYYARNPLTQEIQVFPSQVYDAFGQRTQPVDVEIFKEYYRQQNQDQFPNSAVPFNRIVNFFSPQTGAPLIYYTIDGGYIRFYLREGYDPITGDRLRPVTREVVVNTRSGVMARIAREQYLARRSSAIPPMQKREGTARPAHRMITDEWWFYPVLVTLLIIGGIWIVREFC